MTGENKDLYKKMYRNLKLARVFSEKILELGNKGEVPGFLHSAIGMEAVGVGVCMASKKKDIVLPTHRKPAQLITKGAEVKYMMAEYMGKVDGYNKGKGGEIHCSPDLNIGVMSVESQIAVGIMPIAGGIALANKLRGNNNVTIAFYGDGGANEGATHETMNMAAIWDLPILFVCEHNKYAVSTSADYSSKLENLSERARAYDFSGITIDGMDVLKVYNAAKEIIEKIRSGGGPFILECKTYRYHGHYTGEEFLKLKYRTKEEIDYWRSKDPIMNFKEKLLKSQEFKENEIEKIDQSIDTLMEEAVKFARDSEYPEPGDAFKDMYATEYKNIPDKGWI